MAWLFLRQQVKQRVGLLAFLGVMLVPMFPLSILSRRDEIINRGQQSTLL